MAFNPTGSNSNRNSNTAQDKQDESWKAQGFLNFYLPDKQGGRRKLGMIPLKDSKISERDLMAWLNADPAQVEDKVAYIMSKLILEYNPATPEESTGFDLPN